MFNLGWTEIILILVVALVIFGPGKLPEVGQTLGKTLREFKGAINNMDADIKKEVNDITSEVKDISNEVKDVKDAMDIQSTIHDLQKDLTEAVKLDLTTDPTADIATEPEKQAE